MPFKVPAKRPYTSQEYYGRIQSLEEAAAHEQASLSLYPKSASESLSADLGADLRATSEFVEQVKITGQGEGGSAATTATAVITPALLEGVVLNEPPQADTANTAEMRAPALLGNYHAWKMENKYPIPGTMLVDDYRRRFLSLYAGEAERALAEGRAGKEKAVEVKLAVLEGLDEHRLPTNVESLLEQLGTVVRDKDEAVAANAQIALRIPASGDDAQVFEWLERKPPKLLEIEEKFATGDVNVAAVHPTSGLSGLFVACRLGLLSVVRMYLRAGADASFSTARGVVCLHVCWQRYQALGKYIGDVKRKIRFDTTVDIIEELLQYGANPNACGANGITPLHMAAAYGHDKIVGMLLRHGADPTWRDFRGLTPQGVAEKEGKKGAAQLLANWKSIEKAFKDEEWRQEWYSVLKDNAAAGRESLASMAGKIAPPGTTGSGSPETVKRAKEALWGKAHDPSNPARSAALGDTAEMLRNIATKEALVSHRAKAKGAASGGGGAAPPPLPPLASPPCSPWTPAKLPWTQSPWWSTTWRGMPLGQWTWLLTGRHRGGGWLSRAFAPPAAAPRAAAAVVVVVVAVVMVMARGPHPQRQRLRWSTRTCPGACAPPQKSRQRSRKSSRRWRRRTPALRLQGSAGRRRGRPCAPMRGWGRASTCWPSRSRGGGGKRGRAARAPTKGAPAPVAAALAAAAPRALKGWSSRCPPGGQ